MKNYIVTVNGVSYEVSVEEVGEGQAAAPAAAPVKAAQRQQPLLRRPKHPEQQAL